MILTRARGRPRTRLLLLDPTLFAALLDAIRYLSQMEQPGSHRDPRVLAAAREQVDEMIQGGDGGDGNGVLTGAPGALASPGAGTGRLREMLANTQGAGAQMAAAVRGVRSRLGTPRQATPVELLPPSLREAGAAASRTAAGGGGGPALRAAAAAAGAAAARREPPLPVMMPMFSVAGKKVSLEQLLHDKIQQSSRSGTNQFMRQFRILDAEGTGQIDVDEMVNFLSRYNIPISKTQMREVMRLYDTAGDGNISILEFVRRVLPESYPSHKSMQATGQSPSGSQVALPRATAMAGVGGGIASGGGTNNFADRFGIAQPKVEHTEHTMTLGVDQVEDLIRQKVHQKSRGGPFELRRAFKSFDRDSSGAISRDEFSAMMRKFQINLSDATLASLLRRYDPNGDGVITYDEFIQYVMPPAWKSKEMAVEEAVQKIRDRVQTKSSSMREAFLRAEQDRDGTLSLKELANVLHESGLSLDEQQVAGIMSKMDSNKDGSISFNEFSSALKETEDGVINSEVRKQPRDFMSRLIDPDIPNPAQAYQLPRTAVKLSVPQLEAMLREKIQQHSKGGPGQLRKAFRKLDRNATGNVSRPELERLLHNFNIDARPGDIDALMARYDRAGDGLMDYYDFVQRLMPADYTSERDRLRAAAYDSIDSAAQRLGVELSQAAQAADGAVDRGTISEKAARELVSGSGLPVREDQVQTALAESASRDVPGCVAHAHLAHVLARDAKANRHAAIERSVEGAPKGLLEALHHRPMENPLTRQRAREAAAEQSRVNEFHYALTPDDLERLLREKVQARCKGGPGEMRFAFKHFDRDSSGKISYAELKRAFESFNIRPKDADITALFKRYDRDKTGFISFKEFVSHLLPPYFEETADDVAKRARDVAVADWRTLLRAFRAGDRNRNGLVSTSEALKIADACAVKMPRAEVTRLVEGLARESGRGDLLKYDELARMIKAGQLAALGSAGMTETERRPYTPTPRVTNITAEPWQAPGGYGAPTNGAHSRVRGATLTPQPPRGSRPGSRGRGSSRPGSRAGAAGSALRVTRKAAQSASMQAFSHGKGQHVDDDMISVASMSMKRRPAGVAAH